MPNVSLNTITEVTSKIIEDMFRINFELKGLGSLGRNKEEYFGRRKLWIKLLH